MELDLEIGPYRLQRRTPYSKFRLIDNFTKTDISNEVKDELEIMLEDYTEQINYPDKYFKIEGRTIVGCPGYHDIEYLFIPNGIERIGASAFEDAFFEQIYFPPSLTVIEDYAFAYCTYLKSLKIPNNVKTIGTGVFRGCEDLCIVKLPDVLDKISKEMFYRCVSLECIDIPNSVQIIEDSAFFECLKLKNVNLSKEITNIGEYAFYFCKKLNNISFPTKLDMINRGCFIKSGLINVEIPDSVKYIHQKTFSSCVDLETIKLPKNLTELEPEMFDGCVKLKEIILPDKLSKIDIKAFSYTPKLTNIDIPKDLTYIGLNPFIKSNIHSLTFNYDLKEFHSQKGDLISGSKINKLIINKNVKKITTDAFNTSGSQITSIDYIGSKEEFNIFKQNNKELFVKYLTNIKEIKFINKSLENDHIENTR